MIYYPQKLKREKPRKANAKIYGDANKNMLHKYGNGQKDNYKSYEYKLPITILRFNAEKHKIIPAQKPIDLLEYLIKTYTNENDIVLDNCMGTGSTGVACIKLKRRFIGMEIDEELYNTAVTRLSETSNV